jgi:tellurite methyltransferase
MADSVKLFDDYYSNDRAFTKLPTQSMREYVLIEGISGNALDLGCGDGRNSLFLAGIGLRVEAIDQSRTGIEKLNQRASEYGLDQNIETEVVDVREFDFKDDQYNLINAITILDHLPEQDIKLVIEKVARSLRKGGVLFAKVHTVDDPGNNGNPEQASELAEAIEHYFESDELKKLISEQLEVVRYREFEITDDTHGETHRHAFAEAIARKPD